jgi:predicted nucleic acid-binding protein
MGIKHLIDSNILIEYIGKLLPVVSHDAATEIINQEFNISFISKIEVPGHNLADQELQNFIAMAVVYTVTDAVIEQTIALRKAFRIKIPDAIIAATALVYDLTLVTRNVDDFKNIPGLDVWNPWNIS